MESKLFPKVFGWMFIGLLVTALSGYFVSMNETMLYNIFSGGWYWILLIVEIIIVIFLAARIRKMSTVTAITCFLLYSLINGITLSTIFISYELTSIGLIFGITAGLFMLFAFVGYITKIDLSKIGSILLMALIGIIIATIVNIFLKNETLDIILCIIGIIVFLGLIIYDTKKIKDLALTIPNENNAAIIGAFELYLDFINIFIRLLRLFGNARD